MATFDCVAIVGGETFDAHAEITDESIVLQGEAPCTLPFVDLMDMRLLNYRLELTMRDGMAQIAQLGYQTEEFFEQLWLSYERRSRRALFIAGGLVMGSEGDYAYTEDETSRASIAKLELYPDCLCIVPHDAGARRVPLCFASEPVREGFAMELALDTGETYRIARLGRDTDPFFDRLIALQAQVSAAWTDAHRTLEATLDARLGDAADAYRVFEGICSAWGGEPVRGLFSADGPEFWFAAVGNGSAAVEIVSDEQTATYLYRFDCSDATFVSRLRHAMEAVKMNRRLIFWPDEELDAEPLYRMAVERSSHVRFLRAANAGRVIHTSSWEERLRTFLG